MIVINVLILIILTSQCVCVHSKVIIVNSNNGNDNTECCVNGECACSSLSTALLNIDNNTIINITSQSVALNNTTTMGSGKLTNITITGSKVTIMCNNSGSVYCESCDDVMIKGITWDRCGNPSGKNIAGVTFNGTSNISLVNCTFQHSQLPAVSLLEVSDRILVQSSNFLSSNIAYIYGLAVLNITRVSSVFSSNSSITLTINKSYFDNITCYGAPSLYIYIDDNSVTNCKINFEKTRFISNQIIFFLHVKVLEVINIQLIEISASNNTYYFGAGAVINSSSITGDVFLLIISSTFSDNNGSNLWCSIRGNKITAMINSSNFTDSKDPGLHQATKVSPVHISVAANIISKVILYRLHLNNNLIALLPASSNVDASGTISIVAISGDFILKVLMVNFICNYNKGRDGGALTVLLPYDSGSIHSIYIAGCNFEGNKSPGRGAALYIDTKNKNDNLEIANTIFNENDAGYSVVYLQGFLRPCKLPYACPVMINTLSFISNVGSSLFLSSCYVKLSGNLLFENNTAENGAAMYVEQETTVTIDDEATVQFIANTAKLNGGAIYVNLVCSHHTVGDYIIINTFNSGNRQYNHSNMNVTFINNSARIADNALYFDVPRPFISHCRIYTKITDPKSILYAPCKFNYSQPVNGKITHIPNPCGTLLNGTGASIVTSPHELRLYFPFDDGYIISSISHYNIYFVRNKILGREVKFTGTIFDYFGKPTIPTQFNMQLECIQNTECSEYILISDNHNYILTHTIDNFTMLSVNFKGKRIDTSHINLTITLTSVLYSLDTINATIVVELVPCIDHPGYTHSEDVEMCVCYHKNVKCHDNGNEIKRGYWFGTIASKATTSLCPNHYCKFTDRKQTTESFFELPSTINAQCNDHRVGRACGECSSGYTLSYDSTDCISVDQCGTGWTVLVITLTCLYWIAIVAGVFSLMYFRSQISLEYLYGLIYYYSMVGILLNSNPYVSDGAFWFTSMALSFAQLTPQFLGKLCLVKGMSGIDQLFLHYSHVVAVSLLLLLIVVVVRYSARISLCVSRCIIRVICLLILLSYTSITSTSLQLLLPLKFTDVKEWYTYSSPSIQYFHGRHSIYCVMAVICELVVGIGLPLLLLFEPVLSKKINFIKIKPLLDQLKGCYKDKYRWFAAYYLICRQVIFLIVYICNSVDYSNMLFYLQTACVVIAMIHIWIQPYQNELLNAFDGVMLLCIVLEVNINTFPFLNSMTTDVSIVIVMLPLILLSIIVIKKVFHFYLMKWRYYHYISINDFVGDERVSDVVIRYACALNFMYNKVLATIIFHCRNAHLINELEDPMYEHIGN